jgi:hypothetical protein
MAIATRKETPVSYNTSNVLLELTSDEAIALRTLLRQIGGSGANSSRIIYDSIAEALYSIGVGHIWSTELFDNNTRILIKESSPTNNLHTLSTFNVLNCP